MNILKIMAPLAKLMPFTQPESKPLHAGEIYYLWESLTGGYRIVTLLETYMVNTEDAEINLFLRGIINSTYSTRINPMEKVLKKEGFTVPPQPGTKVWQGKDGVGQEAQLTDEEILRNVTTWVQFGLRNDARAVGACTKNKAIRKLFIDLLFDDMKAYSSSVDIGLSRQVFDPPPSATARTKSLTIDEVARLWEELGARKLTIINLETFIMNTKDKELIQLLKNILQGIAEPQMETLENILKTEGFNVPARPSRRLRQGTPGYVSKIVLNDAEIIKTLILGSQVAIDHHVRSYCVLLRPDIRKLLVDFTSTEIENYEKILDLATMRHVLDNPPNVTSKRG